MSTSSTPTTTSDVRPAAEPPVIEVEHLRKVFGGSGLFSDPDAGVVAVDDVSLGLRSGTTLAVVGESGSGKTTLASMIMGLERPTSGTIRFFGETRPRRPRAADRKAHARVVQMVFQNPYRSLDPRQTIGEALDEVLRFHFDLDAADRAARAHELLDQVRLSDALLTSLPSELSGGQRQRVCIARALASQPRAIILDEAVSALDVSVQAQVLNLLADLQDQTGVSYLFVTHDLSVVRQTADEVIVMRGGSVVERGTVDQVLDAPQHPYTKLLRDAVPREGWKPIRAT